MPDMVRTTIHFSREAKKQAMSIAALDEVFSFSDVMREALDLWIEIQQSGCRDRFMELLERLSAENTTEEEK